ncbi:MAG: peptide ABC transporter substrate-binding protein [Eubacteriales bacterium]|nr:peptide ABC transporter substrate-binding protein [Eubacteriales bacterium]
MKKRLICLMVAALLLPVTTLAENVTDSLVVGMVSVRTAEIRPLQPTEAGIMSLYGVIYESLVTIDDNGLPQPYLAETWTETGNGQTWTFTLRENLTFSDGTPLTANDVVSSCQFLLALAKDEEAADNGFYQNLRYLISSITADGDRTVIVKAARDYYGLLYAMTFPVVPAAQVDQASPLGSGPYVVSAFEPYNYMQLTVNENWWQSAPQVKEIMASFFASNKDLITAYEYGRVDTAFTRSVAAAQYKSGINSLSIAYTTRQLETLMLNHRSSAFPLDSLKVRQAIRYAININMISQNVYMGMTVDADTPVPSDSWLYYDQESTYVYNPDKARELLAEEGWTDINGDGTLNKVVGDATKNLVLQLYVYEDPENDVRYETANMIKDYLEAVGFSINVTAMSYSEVAEKLKAGSFDMVLCSFQMDIVPDYGFMLRANNTGNYISYSSTEMTSLIDALRDSEEQADFAYNTQAIQQLFTNDVPFICLFYRAGSILTRKMYTTARTIREFELLRGIENFGR